MSGLIRQGPIRSSFHTAASSRSSAPMGRSRDKEAAMSRSVQVPAGIFDSRQFGFAQVTIVTTYAGREVHVSGQTAWDAERNIVGAGNIGRQLEKSLTNVAAALESVGAKLDQVGSFRIYIK